MTVFTSGRISVSVVVVGTLTDARPTVLVGDAEGLFEGLGVLAGEDDEDLLLGVVWDLRVLEDPD